MEFIELLIEKGADPNEVDPFTSLPWSLPVLALAILFDSHRGVQTLLALGADPHDIPKDLYIKAISNDAPVSDSSEKERKTWCTKGVYEELKRSLTPNMIYFLAAASRLGNITPTRATSLKENGMSRLPALRLMLIGQEPALTRIFNAVSGHYGGAGSKRPLVMLFAGPPGHEKTYISEMMGHFLDVKCVFLDCSTLKYVSDMFGCLPPYQGSEKGSELVNFLYLNSGKRSVVVLVEFEKTSKKVRDGFLRVFDTGELVDKARSSSKLDCSKTTFCLTTNALDGRILEHIKSAKDIHSARHLTASGLDEHLCDLDFELKGAVKLVFGPSIASRISLIVPFIPFSEGEQIALFSFVLSDAKHRFLKNPNPDHRVSLNIEKEQEICERLFDEGDVYCSETGARRVENTMARMVDDRIVQLILDEELQGDPKLLTMMPDPSKKKTFKFELRGPKGEEGV